MLNMTCKCCLTAIRRGLVRHGRLCRKANAEWAAYGLLGNRGTGADTTQAFTGSKTEKSIENVGGVTETAPQD